MATVQHSAITDPNIHEPKGITTATVGAVYQADGAGSGIWQYPEYTLNVFVPDISTSGSAFVAAPYAGTITKLYSSIKNTITVANNVVSLEIAGVPVTDSTLTITQAGSVAGDVDSSTPSADNAVTAGQSIEILFGGSTTTCQCWFTLVIRRTS